MLQATIPESEKQPDPYAAWNTIDIRFQDADDKVWRSDLAMLEAYQTLYEHRHQISLPPDARIVLVKNVSGQRYFSTLVLSL